MKKTSRKNWRRILLIPSVFMIVASGAFIWGVYSMFMTNVPSGDLPMVYDSVVTAPSVDEYRTSVVAELAPFLQAVSYDDPDTFPESVLPIVELAISVQENLIAMTVPSVERPAHLAAVLMLDQWKQVSDDSTAEIERALSSVMQLIESYPWILGEEEIEQ